jgi:N-acetylmuramoyl-L-alanine amidase
VQLIKRGDSGPAAAEVRATLVSLGLLAEGRHAAPEDPQSVLFDAACDLALREFQQSRGLSVDGIVGPETWRSLVASRWRLGDRLLHRSVSDPVVGDDVHTLQERLLEMGYDVGRADGIFGERTEQALRSFQRECGLVTDGTFGPSTMRALRQLGRKVVGGRPQLLRESAMLYHAGPALIGKRIVIDPGHGSADPGWVVPDEHGQVWNESQLTFDLASRLEGRFSAIGVRADLTRGPDTDATPRERAAFANALGADVLISIHLDGHANPGARGLASYHYGTGSGTTSTIGERLASLAQREIVARTGMLDCRTHAKTWELLRLTRMPAIQIEVGYLTSPDDRALITDPSFRDTVAEAILIAVQRVFLPVDNDVKTGTLDVTALRAMQLS